MINVIQVAELAFLGLTLDKEIKRKEKELKALKEMFRQFGAGTHVYAAAKVEISPPTKRVVLNRKPIEDELGADRLIEIGGLEEIPIAAAVRFTQ